MERSVEVHELYQDLELHLQRVAQGETVEILENGKLIARLTPAPPASLQQLEAAGRLRPASRDLLELGPPTYSVPGFASSVALAELRAED